jgi:hypothetical protein
MSGWSTQLAGSRREQRHLLTLPLIGQDGGAI